MDNNHEAYEYAALIVKHLRGELSPSEQVKLNIWIEERPENAALVKKLQDEAAMKPDIDFFDAIDQNKAWESILMRSGQVSFGGRVYAFVKRWKYAAAVLVTMSLAAYLYVNRQQAQQLKTARNTVKTKYKNDVPPGIDKARLILPDGSVVVMDGHTFGTVKNYEGLKITSQNGVVNYQVTANNHTADKVQYNTIATPNGCKYKITLPDGSLVWLNSGSSLKFPVVFAGRQRIVYLTGEAYFEVAKNKRKPFKVLANNTEVRVLGTHFNVHAYKGETVKTTLLEGSVKISGNGQTKMMVPGQQALIDFKSLAIRIHNIDVTESVAWKNDLFVFDSEDIESVMKEVARWYNVEVEYRDAIPQTHISGSTSRNNNISQILNMLELTGGVHFSIDGRKITVSK